MRHIETAAEVGVSGGETGWILETNEPMNRAMEGMGGDVVKRYRLYEKALRRTGGGSRGTAVRMAAGWREELLEAEAVEEPELDGEAVEPTRGRSRRRSTGETELDAWRGEVRTAAIAAAGGARRRAATVAVAGRPAARHRSGRAKRGSAQGAAGNIVASRSFLIDVHVLGR